jgi:lysophospholipase L1-like esterase
MKVKKSPAAANIASACGLAALLLSIGNGCVSSVGHVPAPEAAPVSKPAGVISLYLIGDSTMANKPLSPPNPERGWGQLLPLYFKEGLRVENHAVNGRSSKSFRDEGRWNVVRDRLKPGDFVIIQFGHNDEKKEDPKRFTEPHGTFKENLEFYIRETRERHATPILATPVTRRTFDDAGKLRDSHGDYPNAVRLVAAEQKAPLLDLLKASEELVAGLGPEGSKRLYDWVAPGEYARYPQGLTDNTHFNAVGATRMCDLATALMKTATPELAAWLR